MNENINLNADVHDEGHPDADEGVNVTRKLICISERERRSVFEDDVSRDRRKDVFANFFTSLSKSSCHPHQKDSPEILSKALNSHLS